MFFLQFSVIHPLRFGTWPQEDIAATDLLLSIPLELIMTDKSSPCAAIKQLRNELQRGRVPRKLA